MVWTVRDSGLVNLSRCTKIDAGDVVCKLLKPLLAIPCAVASALLITINNFNFR